MAGAVRVLLVEDEFLIRLTLCEALRDEGFEVIEAADGADALVAMETAPDLSALLTDLQLPGGVDGCELARRVRQARPGLPVLFMTGRPDHVPARADGTPEAVVGKPYLPSEVCVVLRALLAEGPITA